MRRLRRGLSLSVGLTLMIIISHYVIYPKLEAVQKQSSNNKEPHRSAFVPRESAQREADIFRANLDQEFNIDDILLQESEVRRNTEQKQADNTFKKPTDNAANQKVKMEKKLQNIQIAPVAEPQVAKGQQVSEKTDGHGKTDNKTPGGKVEKSSPQKPADQGSGKSAQQPKPEKQSRGNSEKQPLSSQKTSEKGNVDQNSGGKKKQNESKSNNVPASRPALHNQQKTELRTRYLIYVCDNASGCYGLGDRQRAMVAMYYLAELTGRQFGLIMTSPANLREFYEPNYVKWDFTLSDLPKNLSRKELKLLGPKTSLNLHEVDFNTAHPEDIILIRTNHVFWHATLKNHIYDQRIPPWGRVHTSNLIGIGWVRLMKPTTVLRSSLNKALIAIAEKIQEEANVWKSLKSTECCKRTAIPEKLPLCAGSSTICPKNVTSQACCEKLKAKSFANCPELRAPCSGVDSKKCADHLSLSYKGWDSRRVQNYAHNYCTLSAPISKLNGTIESIRHKKGYDLTDMNLVCAHIRIGHSKTFPFESVRFNKQADVSSVWDFLKGYGKLGYHMYLASDAQEVKDEAKAIFGDRLHMAEDKIVHIDHERAVEDPKTGLQFTLSEQLLLATGCRVLLKSHSGYSARAEEMRRVLMGKDAGKVYRYHDGVVE